MWLVRDSSWVVESAGKPLVKNGVTYDEAKALDGNTETYWNPITGKDFNNWYIVLDLSAPRTLTRIAVNNYGDTTHDIAAFTLQKSKVGSPYNWEDVVSVADVQGGTDQRQEFGGFLGTARYWRFVVTRTHSGWQPYLREVNLYGTSTDLGVPVVVLAVEGGPHTLKNVSEALTREIPVVIAEGSGRAADIIAYAYKRRKRIRQQDADIIKDLRDQIPKAFHYGEAQADEDMIRIRNIVSSSNSAFVSLFKLEEGNTANIDEALFRGLLKAKSYPEDQLQLALAWDRSDIARQEIFTPRRRQKWRDIDKHTYMETALLHDRVEFVQLLLENGVELQQFLTVKRLYYLLSSVYFCNICDLQTIEEDGVGGVARLLQRLVRREAKKKKWDLHMVGRVICSHLLGDQMETMYKGERFLVSSTVLALGSTSDQSDAGQGDSADFPTPENDLFLWAVLTNRRDMARLFWKMGSDHVAAALSASKMLMSLASLAKTEEQLVLYQDLKDHARQLESDACGVLEECHQKDRSLTHDLLVRRQDRWGDVTVMSIAASSHHMTFMSHDACQTKMNLVWKGRMASYTPWWKVGLSQVFPPAVLLITFIDDNKRDGSAASDRDSFDRTLSKVSLTCETNKGRIGLCKAIQYHQTAPVTKFMYNTVFHVAYLLMFSVFLLTDLRPGVISPWEWFLSVVMASLLIEELRQHGREQFRLYPEHVLLHPHSDVPTTTADVSCAERRGAQDSHDKRNATGPRHLHVCPPGVHPCLRSGQTVSDEARPFPGLEPVHRRGAHTLLADVRGSIHGRRRKRFWPVVCIVPTGCLHAVDQRAAAQPAHRHVQLYFPKDPGRVGAALEVPAVLPDRGVREQTLGAAAAPPAGARLEVGVLRTQVEQAGHRFAPVQVLGVRQGFHQ
ncbi:TRPM5 [Branchiostoma lanceolatum]|uniref:TRPM5 protein n=1 Tax=Branchiostoma lanceolatum TaxID=7740 RepID=A0A8J9ZJ31_BRALA|nr:TRPM5 [Branchiostoma lanceolatum]